MYYLAIDSFSPHPRSAKIWLSS